MQTTRLLILGIILLSIGIAPIQLDGSQHHDPHFSEPPDNCANPTSRPVNNSTENPELIGSVSRLEKNSSLVKIIYNKTNYSERGDFSVTVPQNSSIVDYSENLRKEGDHTLEATGNDSQYWIIFDPGRALGQTEYPSSDNWLFSPTPTHQQNVVLDPANQGYIGGKIFFLGEYEVVKHRSGCQLFKVIKPVNAEFNAQKKVEILGSSSRLLDFGLHYSTVYIFASPSIDGEYSGWVRDFESEILLDGSSSVQSPGNLWVHEYVHTLQWGSYGGDLSWLNEGSATYYAARVSLELGLISSIEYDQWMDQQASYKPDTPLADATHEDVAYKWGSALLAETVARGYQTSHKTSFNKQYDELDQYGATDYDEFESVLNGLNLNQTYINEVRATVAGESPPQVNQAYRSRFGQYSDWYFKLRYVATGIGVVLIVRSIFLKIRECNLIESMSPTEDSDDGESVDIDFPNDSAEIEMLRRAHGDLKRTLDQHISAIDELIDRAGRLIRFNILIISAYIAALASTGSNAGDYINIIILTGLGVLITSIFLGLTVLWTTEVHPGVGGEIVSSSIQKGRTEREYLNGILSESYPKMIDTAESTAQSKNRRYTAAQILAAVGIVIFVIGVLYTIDVYNYV